MDTILSLAFQQQKIYIWLLGTSSGVKVNVRKLIGKKVWEKILVLQILY